MGQFNPIPIQDFIGKGLTFPITIENGKAKLSSGDNLIKSSIASILAYSLGQRFFLGEFGSRIEELIEESNEDLLANVLENFIVSALSTWEKRIEVTSVETTRNSLNGLEVHISYVIINTQVEGNFVWPFYQELIN